MKLRTGTEERYFNARLVSQVTLSPEGSSLTVHFVDGTHYTVPIETEEDRVSSAELLSKLTAEDSGFISVENDLLNLKSAQWILPPLVDCEFQCSLPLRRSTASWDSCPLPLPA
jgi:hypothetical protein